MGAETWALSHARNPVARRYAVRLAVAFVPKPETQHRSGCAADSAGDDANADPRCLVACYRPPRKESEMRSALRVTKRYGTPPRLVFDAWIDPATAGTWLFATAS